MGAIFEEILKPSVQALLVEEFQKDLNCDTDPDMVDDILCSEDAAEILLWLGQNVGFSQEEVDAICDEMEGACLKAWTEASCVDDVTDILYPRLMDPENHENLMKRAIEKYPDAIDFLSELGETEDLEDWMEDMFNLIETLYQIYGDIGPGILCGLVEQALD